MEETFTPDYTKHYLTEKPFFITDSNTGEVHILRAANEDIFGTTIEEGGDV